MLDQIRSAVSGEATGFGRIPAPIAFRTALSSKSSKWPSRPNSDRIEPKCGPDFTPSFKLADNEMIFTIGSCFARHIEMELKKHGHEVPAFDFSIPESELWSGTFMKSGALNKYTPHSMLNEVEFAFTEQDPEKYLIEHSEGMYLDLQLHIDKPVPIKRAIERRLQVRRLYQHCIKESRVIIITLGLVETWWDDLNKVYLNETPPTQVVKKHADRFFFEVMSPVETINCTIAIIENLQKYGRGDQKVILTVSPVPFNRTFSDADAIVANSYSKSVLRVAAECVVRNFDHVDYFPSFESITSSDRKLTWEDDQIHVTREMVAFNVGRMLERYSG